MVVLPVGEARLWTLLAESFIAYDVARREKSLHQFEREFRVSALDEAGDESDDLPWQRVVDMVAVCRPYSLVPCQPLGVLIGHGKCSVDEVLAHALVVGVERLDDLSH